VQTGQILFVIDPSRYEAQLASARARLSRAEATLRDTERDLARTRTLHARGTVSDAELDDATAAYEAAEAEIEAARAGVRVAEIDLEDTQIVAPIDGRIGRALVSVGNLVGPASGPLARIVTLDPIRAVFSVSEALLVPLKLALGDELERNVRELFVPRTRLPNGEMYRPRGADRVRRPGGRSGHRHRRRPHPLSERRRPHPARPVRHRDRPPQGRRASAGRAAAGGAGGPRWPLRAGGRRREPGRAAAHRHRARVDQGWAVEEGLEAGETVIVGGVQKVRPGMIVRPIMEGRPAEDPGA
jgi:membrane fusion protein (multidrug efflux system)